VHLIDAPRDVRRHVLLGQVGADKDLLRLFSFPRDELESMDGAGGAKGDGENFPPA
jgi:hypothetical protein